MALHIDGLEKIYGPRGRKQSVHALKPLHLQVNHGEVFGLLGPNGAGKTTLVKLLLGIVFPTSGRATILDKPIGTVASKRLVGYLPENHRYPQYLTGAGVLRYFGQLSGVRDADLKKRVPELLKLVNMEQWKDMRVRKYSKGMMQRIGLAQALVSDPSVVFLDEPTDGVDPVGRREIRNAIARLRQEGKTIFLNSHLLSEVEMICDRVAILDHGDLVRIGTVKELTQGGRVYAITVEAGSYQAFAGIIGGYAPTSLNGQSFSAIVEFADTDKLNACIDQLRAAAVQITGITPQKQTLEELFMDVITDGGVH